MGKRSIRLQKAVSLPIARAPGLLAEVDSHVAGPKKPQAGSPDTAVSVPSPHGFRPGNAPSNIAQKPKPSTIVAPISAKFDDPQNRGGS